MILEISDETYSFDEDSAGSRCTVSHADRIIGMIDYIDSDPGSGPSVRTFTHTEVSPAYGGRGLAAHLVRFALESTVEAGITFRTTCSYVMRFLEKNEEFEKFRA